MVWQPAAEAERTIVACNAFACLISQLFGSLMSMSRVTEASSELKMVPLCWIEEQTEAPKSLK